MRFRQLRFFCLSACALIAASRLASSNLRPAVAFSSASARIRAPGAEGHQLRRLMHGDTRGLDGSEA